MNAHPTDDFDAWFRAKVQVALEEPRPSVPHADVMRDMRDFVDRKCRRVVGWHPPYNSEHIKCAKLDKMSKHNHIDRGITKRKWLMQATADQCRAARSLLGWTQDQLATNAVVSRATIVDFEASTRQPMKNNLRSIMDCLFAAGIDFIPEEGEFGVGVRFHKRKVTYVKNTRIDRFNRVITVPMRYSGEDFACVIDLNTVDDYHHRNFTTDEEFGKALSDMFHLVYAAVERNVKTSIHDGRMLVTSEMLSGS